MCAIWFYNILWILFPWPGCISCKLEMYCTYDTIASREEHSVNGYQGRAEQEDEYTEPARLLEGKPSKFLKNLKTKFAKFRVILRLR
jgi:hypothetical protein